MSRKSFVFLICYERRSFLSLTKLKMFPTYLNNVACQCCHTTEYLDRVQTTYVTVHSSKLKMYVHILMHHQISLESILYCFQTISTFTVNNLRRNRFTIGKVLPCGLVGHRKVTRRPLQKL